MNYEEKDDNEVSVTFVEAPSVIIAPAKSALVPNNLVTKLQRRFNKQSFKIKTNNKADVIANASTTGATPVMSRYK